MPELSSVDSSWVKKRTSRRRRFPPEGQEIEREGFLLLRADVDGGESLAAEFAGYQGSGIGGDDAGAEFAIAADGSIVETQFPPFRIPELLA